MAKPRALSQAEAAEARRRYDLYLQNKPAMIARDFGITRTTLSEYVNRRHKDPREPIQVSALSVSAAVAKRW